MIVLVELPLFFGVLSVLRAVQLENISVVLVHAVKSNELKSKLASDEHALNMALIFVTLLVSQPLKSRLVSDEQ